MLDTSTLIGELLRRAGRERLADRRLELFLAEHTWVEFQHEWSRRVETFATKRGLDATLAVELAAEGLSAVDANVTVMPEVAYEPIEDEARWRSHRDPSDWPAVALALLLDAGVWTADGDFLGTGVRTWSTATIQHWLDRAPPEGSEQQR